MNELIDRCLSVRFTLFQLRVWCMWLRLVLGKRKNENESGYRTVVWSVEKMRYNRPQQKYYFLYWY